MKCPYCNKSSCEPGVVYKNIESYGGKRVVFRCIYCKKSISVSGERRVIFGKPRKTDEEPYW